MAGFDHSVLTDVGWDALTDAEAGKHIEYTHLEAGDGYVYGGDTEIYGMTALKHKVMDFPITNFSNDGKGQITLVGVISSKNVTTGFDFREIGVRCTIDGGPSILYAVANSGDAADYIPSSAEAGVVIQTVQIIIKIDRATNVTVIIQPGLDVTAQNIGPGTAGAGWFRDKQTQILWFKRLASPKKTLEILETSDLISIDVPTIDVNLDMWVALGNPDIFPNFSNIQNALNYLIPLRINPGIRVTIHVAEGVWNNSPTITVNHPQGTQIDIIGTKGTDKTVTTVSSAGGTAVNLFGAVNAFADMAVGDYFIYLGNTGIAAGIMISGICQVTSKAADSSRITYDTGFRQAFPNLGGVSGGTVTPLKTRIHFQVATGGGIGGPFFTGILIAGNGLGSLQYFALTSASYTSTQTVAVLANEGITSLQHVGAWGWADTGIQDSNGFLVGYAGTLNCTDCHACRGQAGFNAALGGVITVTACYSQSNSGVSYRAEGGHFSCSFSFACGGYLGYVCSNSAVMSADNCNGYNNYIGVYCRANSHLGLGPYNQCVFLGNTYVDITVLSLSSVTRSAGPMTVYGSSNIAPYTLSADGALFQP